jgi:Tfp pilus assembly protein PilO
VSPRWRRRTVVVLAVGAAVNGVVFAAYTLPRTLAERRIAQRRQLLEGEVQRERLAAVQQRRQAETIRANTDDVRRFYESTVGGRAASLVPVLRSIEGMAREGGMRPGAASYKAQEVKGIPLDRFVITMPVAGTYRQLVSFVQRLEQSPYFLTLDEVRFSGEGTGSRAALAMVLSCYFREGGEGEP